MAAWQMPTGHLPVLRHLILQGQPSPVINACLQYVPQHNDRHHQGSAETGIRHHLVARGGMSQPSGQVGKTGWMTSESEFATESSCCSRQPLPAEDFISEWLASYAIMAASSAVIG